MIFSNKYLFIYLNTSLILLFYACSPKVQSSKMEEVDLSGYQTFAYLPNSDTVAYQQLDEAVVENKTMQEINAEMRARGYSIDNDSPDLLVKTHVLFGREQDTVSEPVYSSYTYYYPGFTPAAASPYYYAGYNAVPEIVGYDIDEISYKEGTLVVDFIDAQSNEIVWRGWAEEESISAENFQEDLKEYIDEIFDEYPVEEMS